jgi:hypothetical protein
MPKFSKWRTALVLVWLTTWLAGTPARGAKTLVEIVRSTGQANPPKVDYAPRPLEPAGAQPVRGTADDASPNYIRAFGSAAQNSRTPGSAKAGQWHVRWQSPTAGALSAVLFAGDRVLAQRAGGWTLFDRNGAKIAEGTSAGAPITIDPSSGTFYSLGNGNNLQAFGLEKGELRFIVPLGYNEAFTWPVFQRTGNRIVATAIERPMISPVPRPPERSLFQVIEIGAPLQLSPYRVLLSIDKQQDLVFKQADMLPAASGDILWAAMPDLLIRTSGAQNIEGAFSGSFKPISASADEAGWLHLVVATGAPNGGRELWIVTPDGHWAARETIPAAYGESKVPPAIGYDRRVYLRAAQSIAAFSPQGALLWEYHADAMIAGLSTTPDGRVVVAAGKNLLALDSKGKAEHLATLPAAASTSPVVTANGEILVGADAGVVCLSSK